MSRGHILLISTNIFPLPPSGYAGLEILVYHLAIGLQNKGWRVSVVAPKESRLPEGIELISTETREPEEQSYHRYKARLENQEFDCIADHSWEKWSYISSIGHEPELPIVSTIHSSPIIYNSIPRVKYRRFIGLSDQHCNDIELHLKSDARRVYNGIDLNFYNINTEIKRNSRWVNLARYTPEKGFLPAINMCMRNGIQLDVVGDKEIIGDTIYPRLCEQAADGVVVRCIGSVSREDTVKFYQGYKGLLFPLQWSEPFGLVTVEASACGMGVLTLSRGAMKELVKDGVNGYVLPNENELEKAILDERIRNIDPIKAREWSSQFSLENFIDNYDKIYLEASNGIGW